MFIKQRNTLDFINLVEGEKNITLQEFVDSWNLESKKINVLSEMPAKTYCPYKRITKTKRIQIERSIREYYKDMGDSSILIKISDERVLNNIVETMIENSVTSMQELFKRGFILDLVNGCMIHSHSRPEDDKYILSNKPYGDEDSEDDDILMYTEQDRDKVLQEELLKTINIHEDDGENIQQVLDEAELFIDGEIQAIEDKINEDRRLMQGRLQGKKRRHWVESVEYTQKKLSAQKRKKLEELKNVLSAK